MPVRDQPPSEVESNEPRGSRYQYRHDASRRPAALAGGILVAAAVLLAVLAARGPLRLVLAGGSLLQVLVLAAGAVVPAMFFLGAVFALLWGTGIWLGRRFGQVPSAR